MPIQEYNCYVNVFVDRAVPTELLIAKLFSPRGMPPSGLYVLLALIIPPPTCNVNGGILFFQQKFFSFFLLPPNVRGCSTDRQLL